MSSNGLEMTVVMSPVHMREAIYAWLRANVAVKPNAVINISSTELTKSNDGWSANVAFTLREVPTTGYRD